MLGLTARDASDNRGFPPTGLPALYRSHSNHENFPVNVAAAATAAEPRAGRGSTRLERVKGKVGIWGRDVHRAIRVRVTDRPPSPHFHPPTPTTSSHAAPRRGLPDVDFPDTSLFLNRNTNKMFYNGITRTGVSLIKY